MQVTLEELRDRLDDPALTLLDVRSAAEFEGSSGYPCDARQGHIPGARHLDLTELLSSDGEGLSAEDLRAIVGLPAGAEIVCYCHSGSRSGMAAAILRGAGYDASNYAGSWHEWARDPELPIAD
ncbi:MAG: thiosulfate/3-mercaptopyruvate sulfurtransferase [Gaiellaceae bacterium]|jgi:thiosulfate/3-mercaptopyruvate sulfurtransferase|nr:thiosulfate/3-mercaptopyruvate sulfurtransferase [Gaiellaceae bacterium]